MGSCLSSGNAQSSPVFNNGANFDASGIDTAVSVSGEDPPLQAPAKVSGDSTIPEATAQNTMTDFVAVSVDNVSLQEAPSQPSAHGSAVAQRVQVGMSNANTGSVSEFPPGRPKSSFATVDSRMSVYSDTAEIEPLAPSVGPTLPPGAHLSSATTTPAGNTLAHLNRAMILRNRVSGHAVYLKPSVAAGSNEATGSGSGVAGRILLTSQLPNSNVPPPNGAEGFGSGFAGAANPYAVEHTGDSAVFDGSGMLAQTSSNAAIPYVAGGGMPLPPGSGCIESAGVSSAGGVSTIGSAVSAFNNGTGGGAGAAVPAPLYGLGVEAALSEMQQMALIGSGGGGCVYIGRWRGVTVAIKFIVSSDDDDLTRSQREALLSRLASHPHVVQTYATSVTKLTESMFKAKDGASGDALPNGLGAADANISHDLLAGLTTGSWIRGEVQAAMHGGDSGADASAAGNHGGGALPTILETSRSSLGSASAATSGRGGAQQEGNNIGSVSVNHTTTYESDGQMSSSSTTARCRAGAGAGGSEGGSGRVAVGAASTLPPPQSEALASTTATANLSCPTSETSSGLGGKMGRLLQAAADSTGPPLSTGGAQGASGSVVMSEAVAEPPPDTGQQPPAKDDAPGNPRSCEAGGQGTRVAEPEAAAAAAAPAGAPAVAAAGPAVAAVAGPDAAQEPGQGAAGPPEGGVVSPAEGVVPPAGAAGRGSAGGPHGAQTTAVADSFDASFVRDHMGRAKYSIHEVLRQLGAHEGQFLTMVVMEYCDGGSLLAALKEGPFHRDTTSWSPRMWLRSTVRTALEIAHGMQHLHLSGLVHGDLKPGNVLLKGSNQDKRKFVAKVSDLGIAHPVGTADEMEIDDGRIGSIAYMAPEVFRGRIMKASDVYSFGVLLWQLACGTGAAPFEGAHPVAIALGVSEGKMTLRWPPGVFRPIQQLGELCLQTDPSARPSFKSVVGALEKLERHMQRLAAAAAAGGGTNAPGGNASFISPASSLSAPPQHA